MTGKPHSSFYINIAELITNTLAKSINRKPICLGGFGVCFFFYNFSKYGGTNASKEAESSSNCLHNTMATSQWIAWQEKEKGGEGGRDQLSDSQHDFCSVLKKVNKNKIIGAFNSQLHAKYRHFLHTSPLVYIIYRVSALKHSLVPSFTTMRACQG